MPGITLQAAEGDARIAGRCAGERVAILQGRNTGATLADIDIDENAERRVAGRESRAQRIELGWMIDHHRHRRMAVEVHQPRHLIAADHRRGDEQTRYACSRQRFGFQDRSAGDAGRPGIALHAGDLDAFVGLGVRTQRDVVFGRDGGHAGDVFFQSHVVDDERRRSDVGERRKVGTKMRHCGCSRREGLTGFFDRSTHAVHCGAVMAKCVATRHARRISTNFLSSFFPVPF
jgi:hypothetical protein